MAIWRRGQMRAAQAIHHSDQGSQHTSFAFTRRLNEAGITRSVGTVGDALDNAICESLIGSMKIELLNAEAWKTVDDVSVAVFEWLEAWYNRRRRPASACSAHSSTRINTQTDTNSPTHESFGEPGETSHRSVGTTLSGVRLSSQAGYCPQREATPVTDEAAARSDARTLARGAGLGLGGVVFGTLLQFVAFLIVARGLPTGEAGVFFESVALFTIVTGCTMFGADAGVIRQIAARRATGRVVDVGPTLVAGLLPVAVASSMVAVGIIAAAQPIAGLFFDSELQNEAVASVRVVALFIPAASVMAVALAGTRAFGSMREFVGVQNILVPTFRLLGVALAIAAGAGAAGTLVGWGVALAFGCTIAAASVVKLTRGLQVPQGEGTQFRAVARELWLFSGPRALGGVFNVLLSSLDVLLVGALASTKDAAVYAAVSRLIMLGAYTLQAVGSAVANQFGELIATGELERVGHVYRVSTWWMMAVSWPLYAVYMAFSPVIMRIFGPSYVDGQNALVILSVAGLVDLATGNLILLLLMTGRSVLNLANSAFVLVLNVALDIVLIPAFGVEGAAVAWAAAIVANNTIHLLQLRHLIALRPFGSGFWAVAFATTLSFGVIGFVIRGAVGATPLGLVCAVAIGSPLYLWLLWTSHDRLELSAVTSAWGRRRAPRRRPTAGSDYGT
jgi:O-antigen/teichoic acid export membrane protein